MTLDEFLDRFRKGKAAVRIDHTVAFKDLCEFIEQNGFHVAKVLDWQDSLYEYALSREWNYSHLILEGNEITAANMGGSTTKQIIASSLVWEAPENNEFLAILEGRNAE